MTLADLASHAALLWLIAAVVLAGIELIGPGVFLIFLAIGALVTAGITAAVPGVPLALQLGSFALWSVVAIGIGRRWYHQFPVPSDDPLLNDRAARLVGEVVTVTQAIADGSGRARLGDSEWIATGPDAAVGTRLRVVAVRASTLVVAPMPPLH